MASFESSMRPPCGPTISQHDYAEVEALGAMHDVSSDLVRHIIRRYGPLVEEVVAAIRRGDC